LLIQLQRPTNHTDLLTTPPVSIPQLLLKHLQACTLLLVLLCFLKTTATTHHPIVITLTPSVSIPQLPLRDTSRRFPIFASRAKSKDPLAVILWPTKANVRQDSQKWESNACAYVRILASCAKSKASLALILWPTKASLWQDSQKRESNACQYIWPPVPRSSFLWLHPAAHTITHTQDKATRGLDPAAHKHKKTQK
jgi:hypothetical protein